MNETNKKYPTVSAQKQILTFCNINFCNSCFSSNELLYGNDIF